jgi:hypothetical protein
LGSGWKLVAPLRVYFHVGISSSSEVEFPFERKEKLSELNWSMIVIALSRVRSSFRVQEYRSYRF